MIEDDDFFDEEPQPAVIMMLDKQQQQQKTIILDEIVTDVLGTLARGRERGSLLAGPDCPARAELVSSIGLHDDNRWTLLLPELLHMLQHSMPNCAAC
jgi:hypothetical protein